MGETKINVLNETEQKVLNVIKDNLIGGPYEDTEVLENDYVMSNMLDSLSFVSLVIDLEEEFNISMDDDDLDLENLSSFNTIMNIITHSKE